MRGCAQTATSAAAVAARRAAIRSGGGQGDAVIVEVNRG
jgi:hypothetical protein